MLIGTALFAVFAFMAPLTRLHGAVLLALYLAFMTRAVLVGYRIRCKHDAEYCPDEDGEIERADPAAPWWKIGVYLGLGIIGLPLGADILVESATNIARQFSVSETLIGLTLVAVGTSLPELATSISAAFRRQADVALGNVIGSNMANLLGIIGAATFFGEIPVSQQILEFDLWVMIAASLALIPFVVFRVSITRVWGLIFTSLYVGYLTIILI